MASVVGLLEQRELAARRRVDELREEADRIQAELALAERDWKEWAIARSRVGEVLTPEDGVGPEPASTGQGALATEGQAAGPDATAPGAAKPRSQVPVWREGLDESVLSADYQRILTVLTDRARLGQGPLTCQEMAAGFGMEVVPARVEALRSKAKRLVARGWAAEPTPPARHRQQRPDRRPLRIGQIGRVPALTHWMISGVSEPVSQTVTLPG